MHPAQRNKVDISEQQLFGKYGKLPTHKNILMKMQKERKYFDSGDYALSKAGKAPQSTVGTAIPNPENIPHATPGTPGHPALSISPTNSTSPVVKESGLASDENTTPPVDDQIVTEAESTPAATDATMTDVTEPTASAEEAPAELPAPTASIEVDPVSVLASNASETVVTASKSPE
ncbi:hypothetical protein EST38_g2462 [Candolleomyces aberdarensis]|uniref:mRNA stability protein n=1 Tax=Candolleomyces aberdarensis TaxID=2316362 RepID=A0A4Q2DUK1_9AGAR|nr:hypothetical protein EST38_g2462 [Candolleomyces aberdarensis]